MVMNFLVVLPVTMGWFGLMAVATVFQSVFQFQADGTPAGETTTGPAGTTAFPLAFAYVLVFGLGFLVLMAAVLGVYDAIIGRELRRCARTPACFSCGYDLSAVAGNTCPECGTARVATAPTHTVTP